VPFGGKSVRGRFGLFGLGAFIWQWPRKVRVEGPSGVKRPVRIPQQFPGHHDDVGLTRCHDLFGLGGLGDVSDGAGRDADLTADGGG